MSELRSHSAAPVEHERLKRPPAAQRLGWPLWRIPVRGLGGEVTSGATSGMWAGSLFDSRLKGAARLRSTDGNCDVPQILFEFKGLTTSCFLLYPGPRAPIGRCYSITSLFLPHFRFYFLLK